MTLVRIAHLSDPHFGALNEGVQEALLMTLKAINPDLVILSGDITQRARRAQFRAAKSFTERLKPASVVAIPGNHDIPLFNVFARLFWPYRGFRSLFKDHLEKDYLRDGIQVVGLNSTSRFRHVQGDFNIERIKRRFEDLPAANVRIVAFHHPMDCAKAIDEKNLLKGRLEAMKVFTDARVDLIVGGHIHDPHVALSSHRYPEAERSIVLTVAGTCLSKRTRKGAPNSFHLIEIECDAPQLNIKRFDLDQSIQFQHKLTLSYRRMPHVGWQLVV